MGKWSWMLVAPMLLAAGEAAAQSQPVGCVYYGTLRGVDRPVLIALVKKGMEPGNNQERMMLQRIGEQVAQCTQRFGWGDARRNAAVQYFNARTLYDDVRPQLEEYGVFWRMVEAYVATLDEPTRTAYRSGAVTGTMISAAVDALKAAGATKLSELTNDNAQTMGRALAQGVASAVVQKQAEAAFSAR